MSSHSSMRRQPSMMTFSTFISTRTSWSSGRSSALKENSPSAQLKKSKAASWICSRTASSSVARAMNSFSSRMVPMRGPSLPAFFCAERACFSCAGFSRPACTRRSPSGSCCGIEKA